MALPITRATVRVTRRTVPTLTVERSLWAAGAEVVVGVDEVGRGAWAGPISVGAAVLPTDRRVYKVRDSKLLTEAERERLFDRVAGWCRAWSVGHASQVECDELGVSAAQRLADMPRPSHSTCDACRVRRAGHVRRAEVGGAPSVGRARP